MTASACCREPRRVLGSLQLGIWAQETSDRRGRGQDKARKVRTVGRDGQHRRIPAIRQTLRNIERTLRCSGTCYRRSTFDTP
jgi:hypothetical protein